MPAVLRGGPQLGEILTAARRERGWSQQEVANRLSERLGYVVWQSAIARMEAGGGARTDERFLQALLETLGLPSMLATPRQSLRRIREAAVPKSLPERSRDYETELVVVRVYRGISASLDDWTTVVGISKEMTRGSVDLRGYVVNGECLEPEIQSGDVVAVAHDLVPKIGDIVALDLGHELHLARLKRRRSGEKVYINNLRDLIPIADTIVLGPVVAWSRTPERDEYLTDDEEAALAERSVTS